MVRLRVSSLGLCGLALLASCAQTPQAPTAVVTPGPGKTDEQFQADITACKTKASQAVSSQVNIANASGLATTAAGLATGNVSGALGNVGTATAGAQTSTTAQASIQAQYDKVYNDCMYAAGNNVPGMPPQAEASPPPVEEVPRAAPVMDMLVLKVQKALIKLGYLHGGADGIAGPKTAAAISKFETDKGLTVDGVSSRSLLKSLEAAEAEGGAPAPAAPSAGTTTGQWALPPPPPSSK